MIYINHKNHKKNKQMIINKQDNFIKKFNNFNNKMNNYKKNLQVKI